MKKVICFGELLLRLSPQAGGNWLRNAQMPVYLGGAELNVATALAQWNIPVKYVTALPGHYLSEEIMDVLAAKQIDVSAVIKTGDRIGTYYLPQGADLKSSGVIYDRAGSSFSGLKTGSINWDEIFEDCGWLHFTAISPALNEHTAAVCLEAAQAAAEKGLTVSVDLNYRSKLWQYGKRPVEVMPQLVRYCDVLMGNIWAAETLLGIDAGINSSDHKTNEALIAAAGASMKALHLAYPKLQTMAYTFRLANRYFGVIQHGPEMVVSAEFPLHTVVDKAGSGDCFMAGLIYGSCNQHAAQTMANFAAAAAVGKMREPGDATTQTVSSVNNIMSGG